jgi:hypothetical protein
VSGFLKNEGSGEADLKSIKQTKVVGTQQYIRDAGLTFEGTAAMKAGKVLAMLDIIRESKVLGHMEIRNS